MSRSYKRFPGWKDGGRDKSRRRRWAKRQASKKVRRYQKRLNNGAAYKNLFDRWNICDWNFRYYSREEVHRDLLRWPHCGTEPYQYWMK